MTFAAGRRGWNQAGLRICEQARRTQLFSEVILLDSNWLKEYDSQIYEIVMKFRSSRYFRGFGYWIWKPAVLKWIRNQYPLSEILYMDAGSHIETTKNFVSSLSELLQKYQNNGLAWSLPNNFEISWTKQELISRLKSDTFSINSGQVQSGFIFLPPHEKSKNFIESFYQLACEKDGFYFSDEQTVAQDPLFIEHRHDQSVFSLLWKKYQFDTRIDETYPENLGYFPIVATRNNTGFSAKSNRSFLYVVRQFNAAIDKLYRVN